MQKRQEKDNEKAILLNIGDIQEFRDNLYEQEKAAETIRKEYQLLTREEEEEDPEEEEQEGEKEKRNS